MVRSSHRSRKKFTAHWTAALKHQCLHTAVLLTCLQVLLSEGRAFVQLAPLKKQQPQQTVSDRSCKSCVKLGMSEEQNKPKNHRSPIKVITTKLFGEMCHSVLNLNIQILPDNLCTGLYTWHLRDYPQCPGRIHQRGRCLRSSDGPEGRDGWHHIHTRLHLVLTEQKNGEVSKSWDMSIFVTLLFFRKYRGLKEKSRGMS